MAEVPPAVLALTSLDPPPAVDIVMLKVADGFQVAPFEGYPTQVNVWEVAVML